jgi:uncharacterized iron-regulated protein
MKFNKLFLVLFSLLLLSASLRDQEPPAYECYTLKGKKVSFNKAMQEAAEADVILWGELHDNPIAHWLQLRTAQHLLKQAKRPLVLGAEMFESDQQLLMDEYLQGHISEKSFENEARLWPNYKTDYKPLVNLAKENELPFICTNVPRRYASMVFKKGITSLDSLSEDSKKYLPPLPFPYDSSLNCYKSMLSMMPGGHGGQNFPLAQAIKDASMAWQIVQAQKGGKQLLHFNGAYHSDNFESIVWYLKQYAPELNVLTISTVMQSEEDSEIDHSKADFTLVVPADMTRTH